VEFLLEPAGLPERRTVRGFGRDHRNAGGKAQRVGLTDRFVCGFRSRHGKHCWALDRSGSLLPTSPLFKRKACSSTLPAKATRRTFTHISRAQAISLLSAGGEMLRIVCITTRTSATAIRWWLQAGLMRCSLMRRIWRTRCRRTRAVTATIRNNQNHAHNFLRHRPRHTTEHDHPSFENVNIYPLIAKILGSTHLQRTEM
jgi:hypothetical protein